MCLQPIAVWRNHRIYPKSPCLKKKRNEEEWQEGGKGGGIAGWRNGRRWYERKAKYQDGGREERVCKSAALMIGHLPSVVEIERSTKSLPDLNGTKCNS
ncbi:hypothetical protein T11_16046 [Trichinella zimbabwensis]|uniref:Uncharacterized protein n=1 Tax=Trichinella zimbabwensis TaxID=268475 RepID=A0A0V1H928_9BILA|nr:hypothetical protein T11_16046 [Trichinella zimbabwensis]